MFRFKKPSTESACANQMQVLGNDEIAQVAAGSNGSELSMISLQSLVSKRQTMIQLTTEMLNSMNQSSKAIIGNIGH